MAKKKTLSNNAEQEFVWDMPDLLQIVRSRGPRMNEKVPGEMWRKFLVYLNEKMITITPYEFASYDEPLPNEEALEEVILNNSRHYNLLNYKIFAYSWLQSKGESEPQFRAQKYTFFSESLNIAVKVGDVDLNHILEFLEEGGSGFAVVPLVVRGGNRLLYLFELTEKYHNYITNEKATLNSLEQTYMGTQQQRKLYQKAFKDSRQSLPKIKNMPTHPDIVDWDTPINGKHSAIFVTYILAGEDARHVFEEFTEKNQYKNKFSGTPIEDFHRALVYRGITRGMQTTMEFYTPKLSEIRCVIVYEQIFEIAQRFIQQTGIDIDLIDGGQGEGQNASYDPEHHTITIYPPSLYGKVLYHYYKDQLSMTETIQIVLAHELGHAHPDNKPLHDRLGPVVSECNFYAQKLKRFSMWHKYTSEDLANIEYYLEVRRIFNEMELQSEFAAWKFGREYIPEHLLWLYDQDNFGLYVEYREKGKTHVEYALSEKYSILRSLKIRLHVKSNV